MRKLKPLVPLLLLTACSSPSIYGDGLGTPDDPVPVQSNDGSYDVVTRIDLTANDVLPPQAELVVQALQDFSTNPAHTLIALARQAGVPQIADFYDHLPSFVTDAFEGWVNMYIEQVQLGGKPITQWASDLAGLASTTLTQFDLDSELAITSHHATHTLARLDFTPTGVVNVKVPLGGVPADVLTQQPTLAVGEGGAFTLGDQAFVLALGEYAWQALDQEATVLFGADIRTLVGNAVDCANLAHELSLKCAFGVCVGHESDLDGLCEGALDVLVDQVHQRLAAITFEALHLASGSATLVDSDGDGIADRIESGRWDSYMNLGFGLRKTPATFTAVATH